MPQVINFSEAATIGIHSAILIAKAGKPLNAIELSEKVGSTKYYIGKVLQSLVKDGILSSRRGPAGGFSLKKKPADILIYDIYRSVEGEVEFGGCSHDQHICSHDKCIKDNIVKKMSKEFVNLLKENPLEYYL